jgi:hypothetical protein
MARKRQIKPEAFDDPDLNTKPPLARWLFAGLWTRADREGRLKDEPRRLKVQLLPYDDCDIDALLDALAPHHILRYEVDGTRYIQIRHFREHQHPHPDETRSLIPPPPDGNTGGASEEPRLAVKSNGGQLDATASKACTESGSLVSDPESKSRLSTRAGEGVLTPASPPARRTDDADDGRPARVYERLVTLAAEHQHESLPLSLKPADFPKLTELLSRYPDDALFDQVMLDFVRSADREIRAKPITIGWLAYWAGKCEARVRGAPGSGLSAKGQRNLASAEAYLREVGQA